MSEIKEDILTAYKAELNAMVAEATRSGLAINTEEILRLSREIDTRLSMIMRLIRNAKK